MALMQEYQAVGAAEVEEEGEGEGSCCGPHQNRTTRETGVLPQPVAWALVWWGSGTWDHPGPPVARQDQSPVRGNSCI